MDASKGNQYLVPSSISPALPSATGFPINNSASQVWSTGLCDCTEDVGNCCMTCWCPWVTFGQIADIVDRASPSCGASGALYALISCITGCHCIYSHFYRSKLRMQYGLPETRCSDLLVDCFCEPCALCQSYRELKNRGYDMSIGWHADMERHGNAAVQPSPVQERMMR